MNYDISGQRSKYEQGYLQANTDQKRIVDSVISAVDSQNGGIFFVDGPGGTGKTFVENITLAGVRGTGRIALAVASSGIASILLDGGRTAHSRFKIPFDILEDSICDIKAQTALAELLRQTVLIIWDEAPAQHRYCFEAVDRTLKDICQNDKWFGGIVTLLSGNTFLSLIMHSLFRRLSTMSTSHPSCFSFTNSGCHNIECHFLERCHYDASQYQYASFATI